jgi:hypothetical protein
MPKLNQIVAVVSGKKTRVEKEFGELHKLAQKGDLFNGMSRTYKKVNEEGEDLAPETKLPQKSADEIIKSSREILTGIMDAIATQEWGNCRAKASVVVDGQTILTDVPLTVLLYVEKQLNDLNTFVGGLPVLDPAEQWKRDENTGRMFSETSTTVRTKKVQKGLLLAPATDKHPAQVAQITEDVTVGVWNQVKYSTAMPAVQKTAILNRIAKLHDAVKMAREEANSIEVDQKTIAGPILSYVFGDTGTAGVK